VYKNNYSLTYMSLECTDSNITKPWSNLSSGKGIWESNNNETFIMIHCL